MVSNVLNRHLLLSRSENRLHYCELKFFFIYLVYYAVMEQLKIFDFVVVGGGIAGISAIEQVCV